MKIPKRIQLAGKWIDIHQVNRIDLLDDKDGFAQYSKQEIYVVKKDVSPELREQSLVHEALHFILWILEIDEMNKDKYVNPISELLYQLIKQL